MLSTLVLVLIAVIIYLISRLHHCALAEKVLMNRYLYRGQFDRRRDRKPHSVVTERRKNPPLFPAMGYTVINVARSHRRHLRNKG